MTNYDYTGPFDISYGPYNNDESRGWTIDNDDGLNLQITFSAFETESGFDYVYIWENTGSGDEGIARLEGTGTVDNLSGSYLCNCDLPCTVVTDSSIVTIGLASDGSVTGNGFTATISEIGNAVPVGGDFFYQSACSDQGQHY